MNRYIKPMSLGFIILILLASLIGCGKENSDQVVIYTNGDEEVITAMEKSLNNAGYKGDYVLQSFGTSELGGKLMAEGDQLEADLVTMSSYFLESAQEKNKMFADLNFKSNALEEHKPFYTPALAITGALFVNKEVMKEEGLDMPTSIKDLTKSEYEGLVSIPNIMDSSTGWILTQAITSAYGDEEGKEVLHKLIENSGPHLESSGSGPIKKVRAGEVAAGFGLRHQAVADQEAGLPIEFIDPKEGNFSLTESVAVVNKEPEKTELAQKMAEVIIKDARKDLIKQYPVALYKGENIDKKHEVTYAKKYNQPLKVEILKEHQDFFNSAK